MKKWPAAETLALAAALVLVAAFVVSFIRGMGRTPNAGPPRDAAESGVTVPDPGTSSRGRVQVLNATDRAGMAREATSRLRDAGFDVVDYGNAAKRPDSSAVIDRMGSAAIARAVAAELGISRVITGIDSTLFVDVSVILGVDWEPKRKD